jgi:hypothetical protein
MKNIIILALFMTGCATSQHLFDLDRIECAHVDIPQVSADVCAQKIIVDDRCRLYDVTRGINDLNKEIVYIAFICNEIEKTPQPTPPSE